MSLAQVVVIGRTPWAHLIVRRARSVPFSYRRSCGAVTLGELLLRETVHLAVDPAPFANFGRNRGHQKFRHHYPSNLDVGLIVGGANVGGPLPRLMWWMKSWTHRTLRDLRPAKCA